MCIVIKYVNIMITESRTIINAVRRTFMLTSTYHFFNLNVFKKRNIYEVISKYKLILKNHMFNSLYKE